MKPALQHPIVLVDDEKSYAELMSQLITANLGCNVATFTRPLDALSALPAINPAIVVTDYNMPQVNGLEFIRLASAMLPHVPFVLISGHNLAEIADELTQLQALKGYLPKPFGWRTLATEILRVWPTHLPPPSPRANATSS